MESGKGGGAGNYWPGFVDALTNVVIAMVFVIVVLAISLSFLMQILAQRMAARVAELEQERARSAMATAATAPRPLAPPPGASPAREAPMLPAANVGARVRIPVAGNEKDIKVSGGHMVQREDFIALEFAPDALTLDPAAADQLRTEAERLRDMLQRAPERRLALVAAAPDLALSENQRAAFIRIMAVRNRLLASGIAAGRIVTRFDQDTHPEHPTVMLIIEAARP